MFPTCFDRNKLEEFLDDGLVAVKRHPARDLYIWNYTQEAQFLGKLKTEPVLRQLRGLIVDGQGKVIARGFPKFFNLGEEPEQDKRYQDQTFEVEEKLDGSMGIMYYDGQDWAIATRGSFESEQALHATQMLRTKYRDWLDMLLKDMLVCFVFEIVYPENRIVVDYDGLDDLVLIGKLWIADGSDVPWRDSSFPGPTKRSFGFWNKADVIKDAFGPENKGKEGFVLVYKDGRRVKVKLDEYLRLHRIITGCNEKAVWEALRDNKLSDMLGGVPDEFYAWVTDVVENLTRLKEEHAVKAAIAYTAARDGSVNRKDFAKKASVTEYGSILFCIYDGKLDKAERLLWNLVEPKDAGRKPFASRDS